MNNNTTTVGSSVTIHFPLVTFSVAMSVLNVFGNTMTIVAICRREVLQTMPNKFILNLAVSDLIMGYRVVLMAFIYAGETNGMVCLWASVLWNISSIMSIASLVLIAVDRFAYIVRSLRYFTIVTPTRANAVIAVSWSIAAILGSADAIGRFWFDNTYLCGLIFALWFRILMFTILTFLNTTLLVLYGWLLRIAIRQRKRIADTLHGSNATMLKSDYKILKVIFIVVGFTEACWIPFLTVVGINLAGERLFSTTILMYIGLALYVNSASNFFIYAARDKAFYKAYKSLLRLKC